MDEFKITPVWKYTTESRLLSPAHQNVITECSIELRVNHDPWLTLICTPTYLETLAIGFLWNENIIDNLREINSINLSEDITSIDIVLSHPVQKPNSFHRTSTGISPLLKNQVKSLNKMESIQGDKIIALYQEFSSLQTLHQSVGGFHSAALSDGEEIKLAVEDVGRHNCIDKISGLFLQSQDAFTPKLLLLSGRISSEMIHKALRLQVPIIVSRTSPTYSAMTIAEAQQISLIGYLRNDNFTVYSHPERILP